MPQPRILVGTPTTCAKRYALALYVWTLQNLTYENYDVLLVDNSDDDGEYAELLNQLGIPVIRSPVLENPYDQLIAARNTLRTRAIDGGYDYLLSLESDVIAPLDVIERLLAHNKEYVTTIQYNHMIVGSAKTGRRIRRFPALCRQSRTGQRKGRYSELTSEELAEGDLIEIHRGHLGCVLIKTNLLREIEFRHDTWQADDYLLCDDLRAQGFTLWCDTTIPIVHVTDATTHDLQRDFRKSARFIDVKTLK